MLRFILLITCTFLLSSFISAQTSGQLSVSVTTSSAGGNYAPRNIVAIWIEDDQGNFVKTMLAYAANRKTHLNTWQATTTAAGSAYNVVDAITGPTRTSHAMRSCTWNGKDFQGSNVNDGTYYVWMELTDKNATGNYSSFSFTKGSTPVTLNPQNVPSFASISIQWMPTGVGMSERAEEGIMIFPVPVRDQLNVLGNVDRLEILDLKGSSLVNTSGSTVSMAGMPRGMYFVKLHQHDKVILRKIVKD